MELLGREGGHGWLNLLLWLEVWWRDGARGGCGLCGREHAVEDIGRDDIVEEERLK